MSIVDTLMQKTVRRLMRRRDAYRRIFAPSGELSSSAELVLNDLRKFCRGTSSTIVVSPITGQVDPIASGVAAGRKEVWDRIIQNLHVSDADIYRIMENDGTND